MRGWGTGDVGGGRGVWGKGAGAQGKVGARPTCSNPPAPPASPGPPPRPAPPGGRWQRIPAPTKFNNVACDRCNGQSPCYLSLHGPSSWDNMDISVPAWYSNPSAPGLIMATGNVGPLGIGLDDNDGCARARARARASGRGRLGCARVYLFGSALASGREAYGCVGGLPACLPAWEKHTAWAEGAAAPPPSPREACASGAGGRCGWWCACMRHAREKCGGGLWHKPRLNLNLSLSGVAPWQVHLRALAFAQAGSRRRQARLTRDTRMHRAAFLRCPCPPPSTTTTTPAHPRAPLKCIRPNLTRLSPPLRQLACLPPRSLCTWLSTDGGVHWFDVSLVPGSVRVCGGRGRMHACVDRV